MDQGEHRRIGRVGFGDEVMQRLVRRLNPARLDPGRYRLDGLAVARQQEPSAILPNSLNTVSMSKRGTKRLHIG